MGEFQVGDRIIVNDPSRAWAHEQQGIVLATYPPNSEDPELYECLVWHRPLALEPSKMRKVTDADA